MRERIRFSDFIGWLACGGYFNKLETDKYTNIDKKQANESERNGRILDVNARNNQMRLIKKKNFDWKLVETRTHYASLPSSK